MRKSDIRQGLLNLFKTPKDKVDRLVKAIQTLGFMLVNALGLYQNPATLFFLWLLILTAFFFTYYFVAKGR